MKNPTQILRYTLAALCMILLVPIVQQVFKIDNEKALGGYIHPETDVSWDKKIWISGDYQTLKEKYLNQNFGFRNFLVRLHNQIDYTLFNKLHTNSVIIGKDEFLYESMYIESALGLNYIGKDSITTQVNKWIRLKDELHSKGKELLIMIAPGKAGIYPEYVPDTYVKADNPTNYEVYLEQFKNAGFQIFDTHQWFREMKDTSRFPLYGKACIHWSKYGQYLVADSLVSRIGEITNKKMPTLVVDEMQLVNSNIESQDYEIGVALNLLSTISTFPTAKVEFHIDKSNADPASKVTFVSDSYFWDMFNFGFSGDVFGGGQFWYYNEVIYPDTYNSNEEVKPNYERIQSMIEANDVIVVQCTEASMYRFGFGFIDMYVGDTAIDLAFNEKVNGWMQVIRNDSVWYNNVVQQALEEGNSIEVQLRGHAEWMAKNEK